GGRAGGGLGCGERRGWRGGCSGAGMRKPLLDGKMLFTFKRFVLLAGRNGRAFSKLNGSTPQRNDLLLVVRLGELPQQGIAVGRGVTGPVISRMVDALEELGFVKRTIPKEDRRMRIVSITPKGEASLNVLFDNYVSDCGEGSLQGYAEGALMHEWERVFKA